MCLWVCLLATSFPFYPPSLLLPFSTRLPATFGVHFALVFVCSAWAAVPHFIIHNDWYTRWLQRTRREATRLMCTHLSAGQGGETRKSVDGAWLTKAAPKIMQCKISPQLKCHSKFIFIHYVKIPRGASASCRGGIKNCKQQAQTPSHTHTYREHTQHTHTNSRALIVCGKVESSCCEWRIHFH